MATVTIKVADDVIERLYCAFPGSFVIHGEFIAHKAANSYFAMRDCETELDVQCKILEWLSRDACKSEPFTTTKKNTRFNEFMLEGINNFLGTNFTQDDMMDIYTFMGNRCNHEKTKAFITSGYNMDVVRA